MIKSLKILTLLFTLFSMSYAMGQKTNYTFPKYSTTEIPDSLEFEDAIYLYNATTIDIMDYYATQFVVFKRILINSDKAAEDFSTKSHIINADGSLKMMASRIIRKDGSIKVLTKSDMIHSYYDKKDKYSIDRTRKIEMIYPDLQKGDIIDFAYQIDFNYYFYSQQLSLEDDLPSLHTKIAIRNMSMLDLTFFKRNNFPDMVTSESAGMQTLTFERKGLGVLKQDYFNATPPSQALLIYILWRREETLTYNLIYQNDTEVFPDRPLAQVSLNKRLIKNGIIAEDQTSFEKLKALLNHLRNDFKWKNDSRSSNALQVIELFDEKILNEAMFIKYVMKFCSEHNLKFERGFTKSLIDGRFIHGMVSLEQLTQRYYIIYDDKNVPHFLFPPNGKNYFYLLDEIPYYNEGNQSIVLYGERREIKEQAKVLLPESKAVHNLINTRVLLNINLNDSLISKVKRKDVFKGHYSYLVRSKRAEKWLDDLGVQVGNKRSQFVSMDENYPYSLTYELNDLDSNLWSKVDDSSFWFNPNGYLPDGIYMEEELDADFGGYLILPFPKKGVTQFFIQSEDNIELAEMKSTLSLKNSIGLVEAKLFQMSPKMIRLEFNVQIDNRYIQGEKEVSQLRELIDFYDGLKSKKWLFKM